MKKFGLIGFPLGHSFSKEYFTKKFEREGLADHVYEVYPLPSLTDFEELIKNHPDLCGINVTIPHKIGIMYYLNKIDKAAKAIDAVNCIKIVNANPAESFFSGELSSVGVKLIGYNTDCFK
jgi:shikimate dehydrogenase